MPYLSPRADAPAPTQSAVVVAVPEAVPVVDPDRRELDAAAGWGVPPHVTVLYPFAAPPDIDDDLLATLADAIRTVAAFDCRFVRTGWFGEDVVWLDPEPAQPFRALTAATMARFPDYPPYSGAYGDQVVPHLTIGERPRASLAALRSAERAVRKRLPLRARIDRALLITGAPASDSWRVVRMLPLAPEPADAARG